MDKRRMNRWIEMTGIGQDALRDAAVTASAGYADGRLSSGYEAGSEAAAYLPDGHRSSDQRIRAWGDFLIDLGDAIGEEEEEEADAAMDDLSAALDAPQDRDAGDRYSPHLW